MRWPRRFVRCSPPGTTGAGARRRRPPLSGSATAGPRWPRNSMPFTTMSLPRADGVSFVVPVRNGARWLPRVLPSLLAQDAGVPIEVVMVEDGSGDGSAEILARASAADARVKIVPGTGSGAAAALNEGIRHARYPLIAQVDQDVVLEPGWLAALIPGLDDMTVAAAQGYYETDPASPLSSRVMSLDL